MKRISRGTIYHSILDDFGSLFASFLKKKTCTRADERIKCLVKDAIKKHYGNVNVELFPYARTSFYACLSALDLEPGSDVLITPLTIPAFLNVIYNLKLRPVFVDIELNTFNIDIHDLRKKINSNNPKCLLITYLFGMVPNIKEIITTTKSAGIAVLEDFSQAIGAKYNGIPLGLHGNAGFYSSSITKYVDSYNGSFIVSTDKEFASRLNIMSSKLETPNRWRIRRIILKTLIWNCALNKYIFKFVVYDTLNLLRLLNRKLFNKLLGPPSGFNINKELPHYYFEDITNIQCKRMIFYLEKLDQTLVERRDSATKALNAYRNITSNKSKDKESIYSLINQNIYWQFIIPVTSTTSAQKNLFRIGCETGSTNLYDLAKASGKDLAGSNSIKNKHIFIPLHKYLSEKDYTKLLAHLESKG